MYSGKRNNRKGELMKKRKNLKRKTLIIILLSLITLIGLLGSTYSKYITQVEGRGVIEVAKWAFLVNGQTATMTNINLAQTYNSDTLIQNRIAPGTRGSFDIIVDASGSEVGIDYDVKFLNENNKPTNLNFNYNGTIVPSITDLEEVLKGNIPADSTEKVKTFTIQWFWSYETGTAEEQKLKSDMQDTKDGKSLDKYSFDIVVTGRQVEPI